MQVVARRAESPSRPPDARRRCCAAGRHVGDLLAGSRGRWAGTCLSRGRCTRTGRTSGGAAPAVRVHAGMVGWYDQRREQTPRMWHKRSGAGWRRAHPVPGEALQLPLQLVAPEEAGGLAVPRARPARGSALRHPHLIDAARVVRADHCSPQRRRRSQAAPPRVAAVAPAVCGGSLGGGGVARTVFAAERLPRIGPARRAIAVAVAVLRLRGRRDADQQRAAKEPHPLVLSSDCATSVSSRAPACTAKAGARRWAAVRRAAWQGLGASWRLIWRSGLGAGAVACCELADEILAAGGDDERGPIGAAPCAQAVFSPQGGPRIERPSTDHRQRGHCVPARRGRATTPNPKGPRPPAMASGNAASSSETPA